MDLDYVAELEKVKVFKLDGLYFMRSCDKPSQMLEPKATD
jgi:hypothetical protein